MVKKINIPSPRIKFIGLFLTVLLAGSLVFGQARGAVFDEQYDTLPRRAYLAPQSYEGLPSSFSLRQFAPLPGDQAQFGTCVAWAAAYAARTISESIALNRVNQTETTQRAFSPVFVYRNARPDDVDCIMGMQIYTALDFMRDTGTVRMLDIEREIAFPRVDLAYYRTVRRYQIGGYVTLFSRDDRQKPALITRIIKKSISEGRPVIIGMNAPESFNNVREVWRPTEDPRRFFYGHAVTVVGYDDNIHGGAFEILNSWGRKWGNGGYIWIPYDVFVNFVMEAYEIVENIASFTGTLSLNGFVRMHVTNPEAQNTTRTATFNLTENNFYRATESFSTGTNVSFTVGARESAFVYSFTVTRQANSNTFFAPVLLFPQAGVSALLNYSDSEITLPGENRTIQIDSDDTKYLITLYSKQALDIQGIMRDFISTQGTLNKRLVTAVGEGFTTSLTFIENEASFTATPDDPRTVAALIIAIN